MITGDVLMCRHYSRVTAAQKDDSDYGSTPLSLFDFETGEFNNRNWNGGDGVVRQFANEAVIDEDYCKEYDLGDEYGDMVVSHSYFQDQQYYQITLRHVEDEVEGWKFTQYLVTYYKNRGKTEWVSKNGKVINFDEYLHLLDIIESTGFVFDLVD